MRTLAVMVWCLLWPLSELFGRPREVEAPIAWTRAVRWLGALIVTGIVLMSAWLLWKI